VLLLSLSASPARGIGVTCDYTQSDHKVKIVMTGGSNALIRRDIADRIRVNDVQCDRMATVYNTDTIYVFAGAGTQFVTFSLSQGGFKPGFTDERGTSDEIEISVSLGPDPDSLHIYGNDPYVDHIRIGKSTGFAVLGKINLNSNEATGIDADLTMIIGVEERIVLGRGGDDDISGAGGAGTGDPADFLLKLSGGQGDDQITGSAVKDSLIDHDGADVIQGLGGPDVIDVADGNGGDQIFGGSGDDLCNFDAGDSVTNC